MQGDMEAYDELMPNARPEDRANFENAIKKKPDKGDASQLWVAWALYLFSITLGKDYE